MKSRNLLIIGAGAFASVAYEVAVSMNSFDNIAFIDDVKKLTYDNMPVYGTLASLKNITDEFSDVVVAIGNADTRQKIIQHITEDTEFNITSLISPSAHISPSTVLSSGLIVEPSAVVQSGSKLGVGCIISSGAVVGHNSVCGDYVHIDCNATVPPHSEVPHKTKLCCGQVFK